MSTKPLERKFLDRVDKAPITFGDLSPKKSLKQGFLYMPLRKMAATKKIKSWVEAGDPIISAAFDVATGRRMVELFERDLALKFLGKEGALGEIKRSTNSGFLSKEDAYALAKNLRAVIKKIKNDGFGDSLEIYSILHELRNIQIFLDKQHYASFLGWLVNLKENSKSIGHIQIQ